MPDYDQLTDREIAQEVAHNGMKYAEANEREELE